MDQDKNVFPGYTFDANSQVFEYFTGINLREYYMGEVLKGFISNNRGISNTLIDDPDTLAQNVIDYTDAFLTRALQLALLAEEELDNL